MDIKEIVDAVNAIQGDIFESTGGIEYFNISVETDGWSSHVKFLGIVLWSSEDDCRLGADEDNPEPIENCLRRCLREELEKLTTIVV